ncbi:NAD-glutamate dehydrogenase [Rhodococcus tukisamuensis]|uniref:Glutamate dehydrogenase n=1 Tax=Rhodococcus tukisamuensis TaxID=168276 RepID=A0A1G7A6K5_9NOCA|nr:NAD-glutamate dehydrogenase [Rhodococcus tukisamuensis]SDE10459.1 glutamate dehydrogenase [Rhodococcus tukisamuensis]
MTVSADRFDEQWAMSLPAALVSHLEEVAAAYFRNTDFAWTGGVVSDDAMRGFREHLIFARHRRPGQSLSRVFTPAVGSPAVQIATDDMPMLVESVTALLTRLGVTVVEIVHPVLRVRRGPAGDLEDVLVNGASTAEEAGSDTGTDGSLWPESWMHLQLHPATDAALLGQIGEAVHDVLLDVRQVIADTDAMRYSQLALAEELEAHADREDCRYPEDEVRDCAELLHWLAGGNFALLGYRRYEFEDTTGTGRPRAHIVPDSGLGVLGSHTLTDHGIDLPAPVLWPERPLLMFSQGPAPATVHRSVYPFFVAVTALGEDGRTVGEHRFLGVFTVTALHENILDIPVIARRAHSVIERAGFDLHSFSGQAMLEVIQSFPRAELFASDEDTLYETVLSVLAIGVRRQARLFLRDDRYGHFTSALVYLSRDRYNTRARLAMQSILMRELRGASLEYSVRVTESDLAMVHFTIRRTTEDGAAVDVSEKNRERIEGLLAAATRAWDDDLMDATVDEPRVTTLTAQRYATALPEGYKEDFGQARATHDIVRLEALTGDSIDLQLYRRRNAAPGQWRFTLYIAGGDGVSLSQVLPVLQSLGVEVIDERPYEVTRPDGMRCWIYDFGLSAAPELIDSSVEEDLDRELDEADDLDESVAARELQRRFTEAFTAVWQGRSEPDRFNELVLRSGLEWRQAVVLRAYAKYLRQARFPYSQFHIEGVLVDHAHTTRLLSELFCAIFDPDAASADRAETLVAELRSRIDAVLSLDEDRILRGMLGLVLATLRTNAYVTDADAAYRDVLVFKLDPSQIADLPRPRPRFEVFVYSPRVEGVHLRFGPVARGGLRWSDRREDFRTEVLGLVKAQAVKNAVIVPVGAKGGFVVKRPPAPTGDAGVDRQAALAEGQACYRLFVSGLLDVTDNVDRASGAVLPAPRVVRRDGDDTYLVVAADKGTAAFSDLANDVAAQYDYWLGDAFASGGSVGYDHKAMGITARGAWESVKRHFRELGLDTAAEDFTVAGIGDMSGDVFGNGMLLSRHIRLVAAFDHRHIFLDPNPVAESSFAERQRLFGLPRSSWADYDASLIGAGGGVWERTRKSVAISAEARAVLGLDDEVVELSPPELVRAILRAPVDLLWNGGIGTYVKAADETDAQVGDKSNDGVRVDGCELRARVVGEGGNLGFTSRGRIEYDLAGGRINTDAVDNSAGVDCSDHEVNIKILLDAAVHTGALPRQERNELLASMTDEVTRLVLADNVLQNELMGASRADAPLMLSVHERLIDRLESKRGLDRELEALPTTAEIARRRTAGIGLTSPELATLLAHVKLELKDDLLASELPDSDTYAGRLPRYFPVPLRDRFAAQIRGHRLRRQIVATLLANETVDRGGISYVYRLREEAGANSTDATRAFSAAAEIFDLRAVWVEIGSASVDSTVSDELTLESCRLLDRASRWLLSNRPQPVAVGAEINRYAARVRALTPRIAGWLTGHHVTYLDARMAGVIERGCPHELAERVYRLLDVFPVLDIIDIADITEREHDEVGQLYYALDEHLGIDELLTAVSGLERGDRWHSLARLALRDDLYGSLRSLTMDVLVAGEPDESAAEKIADWESTNSSRLARARAALTEIIESGTLDLATLSVAARQVRSMVRGAGTRSEGTR